jgi:hypothetical protein
MGEMLDWWLSGGDGADLEQNRRIEDLASSHAADVAAGRSARVLAQPGGGARAGRDGPSGAGSDPGRMRHRIDRVPRVGLRP